MSKSKPSRVERSLKVLTQIVSGFTLSVGLVVLLGWAFDVSLLKTVVPGFASMKANTALAFVFSGITLCLMGTDSRLTAHRNITLFDWIARACAVGVALLGFLTLSEYFFGWELGMDQFLFRDIATAQISHPGRMAPMTALNFTVLGVAFLLVDVETRGGHRPAQWLALVVGFDAFLAILGYAYGVEGLYRNFTYSSMALHTAVLFFVIPIGFLFVRSGRGLMRLVTDDGPGGVFFRRLLPAAILVPPVIGGLRLAGERAGFYRFEFGLALFATSIALIFSALVWWTAQAVWGSDVERREAERSLRASEEKFHLLVDGVTDYAIVLLDAQGNIESWNSGAQRVKGYTSEEIVGRNYACFYTTEDQKLGKPEAGIRLAEALGRYEEASWRVRKDGSQFFADTILTALKDSGGKLRGFAQVTRDITERKRAEEAQRESDQRLRHITDNLNEGLVISSVEGQLLHWNKAALALFGFGSVDECLRKLPEFADTFELWTLDGRVLRLEEWPLARVIAGEHVRDLELHIRRFGIDRQSTLCFSGAIVKDDGGKAAAFLSFADITERKQAEELLKASLKNVNDLKTALDEHAIVAITDPQGRITFINDKFCAISKYSREELLGQDNRIINSAYHSKEFIRDLWTTIASGKVWKGEIKNKAKDGSFYWVDTTIVPFLNAEGKPYQYVAIRADITERKQQAEELKRSNESLERSNVELQQLAYIASHDLQTPLRKISGFVQLLKSQFGGKLDEKANEWIQRTVQATEQMHTLIQDVLDYSSVDSRARPFEPVVFREVFNDAVAMLDASIRDAGGQITCDELPTVMGDRSQLTQLMQNLIGNGLKYHGNEPPHVHVSAKGDGTNWVVCVRDNGIGIAPKYHERIFEIFKRLHSQQEYPGTGIGLAICRRVVHRHGGKIWVESELGHGSVFHFTIPERTVEKLEETPGQKQTGGNSHG